MCDWSLVMSTEKVKVTLCAGIVREKEATIVP